MRSFIFTVAAFILVGCTFSSQSARSVTSVGVNGEHCVDDCRSYALVADEPYESLPTDGLNVRFRVPPGWRVSLIQHNYIGLRSDRDSAFITVRCDDGSVQWGLTYYMLDRDPPRTCQLGYEGEPAETCDHADYQSYMDDTDEQVYIYVNWPDYDAIPAFAEALALRDGGTCRTM